VHEDPEFAENAIDVESDPQTYKEAAGPKMASCHER